MKFFFLFILSCILSCNYVHTLSLRAYSVVWRNVDNKVVKRAIYDSAAVFTPKFPTENDDLNCLPNGYVYHLHVIQTDHVRKILYTSKRM